MAIHYLLSTTSGIEKKIGGGNLKYKYHLLSSATMLMHDEIKRETKKKCKCWWVYSKNSIKY